MKALAADEKRDFNKSSREHRALLSVVTVAADAATTAAAVDIFFVVVVVLQGRIGLQCFSAPGSTATATWTASSTSTTTTTTSTITIPPPSFGVFLSHVFFLSPSSFHSLHSILNTVKGSIVDLQGIALYSQTPVLGFYRRRWPRHFPLLSLLRISRTNAR